jgi:hypothetical protein
MAQIREVSAGALLAAMVIVGPAIGQTARSWADPPALAETRGEPAPTPKSDLAARPPATRDGPVPEQAARQLAVDYLDFWSAPNALTLEVMPDFYGSKVVFHGREMSADALMQEKRRFVRRWPVRSYTARIDTLRASCEPSGEICTVRGLFDFTAISPERGRRSQGAADLELRVSLAGEHPTIVSETSRVVARGRTRAAAAFDELED